MSGVDYEAAPCPCGCGWAVPKGRRWATASCGNKARAARRRAKCPELRPETPGEEIWEKLTEEQRQGIMNAAAAHAWRDWMLINEKEAAKRMGPTIDLPIPLGRRPDLRTGKKRLRVYLSENAIAQIDDLIEASDGEYATRQALVEAAIRVSWLENCQ